MVETVTIDGVEFPESHAQRALEFARELDEERGGVGSVQDTGRYGGKVAVVADSDPDSFVALMSTRADDRILVPLGRLIDMLEEALGDTDFVEYLQDEVGLRGMNGFETTETGAAVSYGNEGAVTIFDESEMQALDDDPNVRLGRLQHGDDDEHVLTIVDERGE